MLRLFTYLHMISGCLYHSINWVLFFDFTSFIYEFILILLIERKKANGIFWRSTGYRVVLIHNVSFSWDIICVSKRYFEYMSESNGIKSIYAKHSETRWDHLTPIRPRGALWERLDTWSGWINVPTVLLV